MDEGGGGADGMRAWWGKRAGESSRCEDPAPTGGMAGRALRGGCDPNAAHDNRNHQGIMRREGRRAAMVCAHGGANGRGNLRVAKTPPLQSGVCGDIVAEDCHTDHHLRPTDINGKA